MNSRLILLVCGCLLHCLSFAQSVTGCVVDDKQQALPYVNVVLLDRQDSAFVKGVLTDDYGRFSMNSEDRNGILKFSMVGYKTIYISDPEGNLGNIKMQTDSKMLSEVLVKGTMQPFKLTPSGIRFNVSSTSLKTLGTAEDVLCQMPGIKKKDNSIEVFGKGVPVIYLDGRQLTDNSELSQLSSDKIQTVEIVRNPGSQYDASVKCVVKILTIKNQDDGFGCDIRTAYFLSDYNYDALGQFNWSYSDKKIRLYGSAFVLRDKGHYPSETEKTVAAETLWNQKFSQVYNPVKWNINTSWGADWNISNDHELGCLYMGKFYPSYSTYAWLTSEVLADGSLYDKINSICNGKTSQKPTHHWDLFYNGKIGNTDVRMDVKYLLSGNTETASNQEKSLAADERMVDTKSVMSNKLLAAKAYADYKMGNIDVTVGMEYNNTHRHDDYISSYDNPSSSFAKLVELHVAPFFDLSCETKAGQFSLGLRYEEASFKYFENQQLVKAQSRNFRHFFPSLTYSKEWGDWQLMLAYATRTERPTYMQLSNNVRYANRFLLDTGNPYLKHEYLHDVSLSGGWKWMMLSLEYTDRRHAIISWAENLKDNSAITKNTYINIPTLKNLRASIELTPKIGCWSPVFSASWSKQRLTLFSSEGVLHMNKPMVQVESKNMFAFAHGWTAFVDFLYNSKGDVGNVYNYREEYGLNLGCTKSFWKGRASLQLKATDLFLTKYGEKQFAGNVIDRQDYWLDSREISLTFRLKIRKVNSKFKGVNVGDEEIERL